VRGRHTCAITGLPARFIIRHSRTNHITLAGGVFTNEYPGSDPDPTVDQINEHLKIYPDRPGS
jgi:hypothetical protein